MKRAAQGQYGELFAALASLDLAMKQPILIGVYSDSFEVSDEHITRACVRVNGELEKIAGQIERIAKHAIPGGAHVLATIN